MDLSKMRARTKMRTVAGHSIARQNRTSKAFAKAEAEAKNAPYAGESGIDVEGNKPKPRLDRPARASGGRVCRADGGAISKEREDYAKKKDKDTEEARDSGRTSAMITGGALGMLGGSKLRKAALGSLAALSGGSMVGDMAARHKAEKEAEWARSGRAEDGKEDRKRGGRVARDKDCD